MVIKRYLVKSMNEAMTRIRYELGNDAIIISQRKIKRPGFKGFFSKKIIEVTAAIDDVIKVKEEVKERINEKVKEKVKEKVEGKFKEEVKVEVKEEGKTILNNDDEIPDLMKEMKEMKELISNMITKVPGKVKRKSSIQIKLENSDLNEKVIKKILTKVKTIEGDIDETEKLKQSIEKMVSIKSVKLEGIIALVGPTGVGKTTTIAKLAGKLSLVDKKSVGLITIDTYRIGAVDQLKTYADIMNIPFKVVLSCKELEAAIMSMKKCDVIIVDTTGRSSKNAMQISELRAFVDKLNTENIHLVLSSTTKNRDIETIIEGYKILKYNNVIITKLDETSSYGSLLNILDCAKKPLSFVTTGQNVPEDIKVLTPSDICDLILGGQIV